MTNKVRKIRAEADIIETLAEYRKRFNTPVNLQTMIAEKTIAALTYLDGYGFHTVTMNGKKIFIEA